MSPAPMRIPSSAKTTAAAGCMSANSGHRSGARSITSGSAVNARGTTSREREEDAAEGQAGRERPARTCAARRRRRRRRRRRLARRPTMTWPAIAIASSTSARKTKSWKAIWCAREGGRAERAQTALASTKPPSSAAVRTKSWRAHAHQRADAREVGRARTRAAARRRTRRPSPAARSPCPTPSRRGPSRSRRRTAARGRRWPRWRRRRSRAACAGRPCRAGSPGPRARSAPRQPERRDAQVARREVGDLAVAAERGDERPGQRRHAAASADPGAERQPQRLRRRAPRAPRPDRRRAGARPGPSSP